MLKKINVRDVRLGMFIHELCGSWMDHPFWKKEFKLSDTEDLKSLKTCGIKEIWIDTVKGLDVEPEVAAATQEDQQRKVDSVLHEVVNNRKKGEPHVALHEEIQRAKIIHTRAKEAVVSMFHEVRMGKALELEGAVTLVDEITESISRNSDALLSLSRLKNKDDYTYLHSVAVCALMIALGRQFGIDGDLLRSAGMAGLLHDVGKMMIPDDVLNKPGKLTDEEFSIIKKHPMEGWEVLKKSNNANGIALDVCRHHHERVDGTGYPDKLSGDALTLFARMGAVCDVYDALTSNRCYKNGWAPADTIRKMAEWQAGHFDERVFHAFVKTVGIYPSGTLVKLKSGRLGVVTDQTDKSLLTPIVKIFFSIKSNAHVLPELVDLSKTQDAILNAEDPAKWGFDMKELTGVG